MKIVRLEVENVKRIIAVDIEPDGELVVLSGDNGAGKSSILDAIAYAIGGKKLVPAKPIREGAKKASVKMDLGDLVIERTFWFNTKDGSLESKIVVTEAGSSIPLARPQETLDKLYGLFIDPLEFVRMDREAQLETLKAVAGIDTAAIEAAITEAFEERKTAKRIYQEEESRLRNLKHFPDAPAKEIDVDAKLQAAQEADSVNNAIERDQQALAHKRARIEEQRQYIAKIEAQIKDGNEHLNDLRSDETSISARIIEPTDTSSLWEEIKGANAVNVQVRTNAEYANQEERAKTAAAHLAKLEALLEEKRSTRLAMIEGASFPIEGLSFDATGVLYNGLPFDQASSAEQLRVSAAMAFAMNPEFKVILIRDGSLLDSHSRETLRQMAKDADAQVWMEVVGKSEQPAIIIEDGRVKEE